jgi:cobalt-zinc-cadmium resistance protein CzcA
VQAAEALIGTGRELPKGSVDFQYGKTQTYFSQDYTIIANQNIPWPSILKAQVKALSSQKIVAEKRLKITQNLVASSVKWYYYLLMGQQKNHEFLQKQDSIYSQMKKAAALKFKEGETNRLEMVAAESRLREFQQKRIALESDMKISLQNLAYWMNYPQAFEILANEKLNREINLLAHQVSNNPQMQLIDQQIDAGKLQVQVEREKLKPDLRFGVVSQSIENFGGQNYVQAGIGIPIFAKGQKARVTASVKQVQVLESQKDQNLDQLSREYTSYLAQLNKYSNSLTYFQETALPQANWLESTALKSYKAGEIEYVEMLQNAQQAWQIREQYVQEILAYNQTVIQIETILGNE